MTPVRARVQNGKWVLEDPADLPEGTVVEIVTRPVAPTGSAGVYVDAKLREYIRALLVAGGSPSMAQHEEEITDLAKAAALGANRRFVTPVDIKHAAPDVLRRFVRAERVDDAIRAILDTTPTP